MVNVFYGKNDVMNFWIGSYVTIALNDAFAKGLGLDWVPDNCDGKCKIVQYIFERDVTDPRWDFSYEDELPERMRKWL